ncbi:MAG: Fic family protein [Dehalococcoidia bacterium]
MSTSDGALAFVPDPLPPQIDLDAELQRLLEQAALSLGELRGLGHSLPNPELLVGPLLRREALFSSRIEGTIASAEQLALFEADPSMEREEPSVKEVRNYVDAARFGLSRMSSLPVSLRLIREVHERLMTGVRGEDKRPGEFRTVQNWIGRFMSTPIHEARFVPPPPSELPEVLNSFELYTARAHNSNLPDLVELAVIHYQFETIHPFEDGNGRVGRLLLTLLMAEWQLLSQPLLQLSAYFDQHHREYMDRLLAVSQTGAWRDWICFFLRGVENQSRDAVGRSRRLLSLREEYRAMAQTARVSPLLPQIVDDLFRQPAITIPQVANRLDVTYRTAQHNVDKLIAYGILTEVKTRGRARLFVASKIVDVI